MDRLPPWEKGHAITHQRLNKMQVRAELAGKVRGAGATRTHASSTGTRISSRIVVPPVLFRVYQPLTYPANTLQAPSTEANRVYLNPGTGIYELSSNPIQETLFYPSALRTAAGHYTGIPKLRVGELVHAVLSPQSGRWEILGREPQNQQSTYPFELTENLTFGSNATAKLLVLDGGVYSVDDDVTFEVYDPFSKFNQNCKPTGQDGARGHVTWISDSGRFEIGDLEHQAKWIKFIINYGSGYATTDLEWTVDGVQYIDGYEPDTPVTSVWNTDESGGDYKFEGDDDDEGEALYDPVNDKYWIVQMECP